MPRLSQTLQTTGRLSLKLCFLTLHFQPSLQFSIPVYSIRKQQEISTPPPRMLPSKRKLENYQCTDTTGTLKFSLNHGATEHHRTSPLTPSYHLAFQSLGINGTPKPLSPLVSSISHQKKSRTYTAPSARTGR